MSQPLVSVILAVRDGEKYLAEALDSIAAQDVADIEVIVVDDGSKDAPPTSRGDIPSRPASSHKSRSIRARL